MLRRGDHLRRLEQQAPYTELRRLADDLDLAELRDLSDVMQLDESGAALSGSLRARVRELSLGDYVLNGGEVAAMAMIEAIGRLVPGVVGNPASLEVESHEGDGLLEAPSYTKPQTWRGLEVPEILLSGHHARIEEWRRQQRLERTRRVRPDLLPGD